MHPTRLVLLATVALLVVYDLWAMMVHGYDWTISKDMREFAGDYPIVPLAIGGVLGHLYWPHPWHRPTIQMLLKMIAGLSVSDRNALKALLASGEAD
jgi:hypothetical protein